MNEPARILLSYFPGCSLASSARENNQSLLEACRHLGVELVELDDWNCCGTSSAHSIDTGLAYELAERNLSLAPRGRPLLAACPSCILRLRQARRRLAVNPGARRRYAAQWGRAFDDRLEIVHFFDLLEQRIPQMLPAHVQRSLSPIKCAPYYGCMLGCPPALRHGRNDRGLMEKILNGLGATIVQWGYASHCCGTFLAAARPDVVHPMVNAIATDARSAGADCMVTACAMCHLNLEVRCTIPDPVPILHFSEILSLAFGVGTPGNWFSRHLVDPLPMLESTGLMPRA